MFIANKAGDIDRFKWDLRFAIFIFDQMHGHHNHARDPEENDIETGNEHIGGVKYFQALGLLGPALSAESPERRAKPGV